MNDATLSASTMSVFSGVLVLLIGTQEIGIDSPSKVVDLAWWMHWEVVMQVIHKSAPIVFAGAILAIAGGVVGALVGPIYWRFWRWCKAAATASLDYRKALRDAALSQVREMQLANAITRDFVTRQRRKLRDEWLIKLSNDQLEAIGEELSLRVQQIRTKAIVTDGDWVVSNLNWVRQSNLSPVEKSRLYKLITERPPWSDPRKAT